MDPAVLAILLAIAVVCIGLALLIGHALVRQVLAIIGVCLGGVVLLFHLLA